MNKRDPVQSKIKQTEALKEQILRLETNSCRIAGALLFGSAACGEARPDSDLDLAIIYGGEQPAGLDWSGLDLFLWTEQRWQAGFPLQIELARNCRVLYDPRGIVEERLNMIREQILPHWEIHLKRL